MGAAYPIMGVDELSNSQLGRETRSSRFFAATMQVSDQPAVQIAVRNVSAHGLGARSDHPPAIGTIVKITLSDAGDVVGEVRWVSGHRFGVRLDDSIDTSQFNFSGRSWSDVALRPGADDIAKCFQPSASTWRPGFRVR